VTPGICGADPAPVSAARRVARLVTAFQGVAEHLPQGRGVEAQGGGHAVGHESGGQRVEFFQNAGARPVELDVPGKDVDAGKAKNGRIADGLDARNAQQVGGERVGNLVLVQL